jgi:hypothetical protein
MDQLAKAAKCSLGKLSQLQKLTLVVLCEPRYALLKRREFRQLIKQRYYGQDSPAVQAALSRALRRLEERDYIMRRDGRWQLTDATATPWDSGLTIAFMGWTQNIARYARCGFSGPSLAALGLEPKKEQPLATPNRLGVHVPGFD